MLSMRSSRWPGALALLALCALACQAPASPPAGSSAARPAATATLTAATRAPQAAAPAPTSAPAPAAQAPLSPPLPVRVGAIGSSSDSGIYIALDRGYFKEQGLDVSLEAIRSATDVLSALATGTLDVAGGGLNAGLYNALRRGVDVRIVADKGSLLPGFGYEALLVRKDLADSGRYTDYADLRGMKIAVNTIPSIDSVLLDRALERGGLSFADVDVSEISFPDQLAAFGNRAIDASLLIEPFVARAVEENLATRVVTFDQLAPSQQISVLIYGSQFLQGNPEGPRRFMVAYLKGVRDYNDAFARGRGKDEVVGILTKNTTIRDAALWEKIAPPGLNPDGSVSKSSIAQAQDFFAARGQVPEKADVDQLVDNSYVEFALQQLGPYSPR
jgi:NitT/TauT family transport system substrate-binding protein